jgi:hypothetical protein
VKVQYGRRQGRQRRSVSTRLGWVRVADAAAGAGADAAVLPSRRNAAPADWTGWTAAGRWARSYWVRWRNWNLAEESSRGGRGKGFKGEVGGWRWPGGPPS